VFGALLVIVVGLYIGFTPKASAPTPDGAQGTTYKNDSYGISFTYPEGYVVSEGEKGDAHRGHYNITLIRKEDSAPRENSEGPTAVTIDIYQNNIDQQTLIGWLTGSNASNYKLVKGGYSRTAVASAEAVSYAWSGLYEGDTTAFRHNGNIIAVSVTHLTPEDTNVQTYQDILSSIKLTSAVSLTQDEAIQ